MSRLSRAILASALLFGAGACDGPAATGPGGSAGTGGAGGTTSSGGLGGSATTGGAGGAEAGGGTGGAGTGGTTTMTGSAGSGTCCDCDGDTHNSINCGGDDCDDADAKVYPGEPTYYTEPSIGPAAFNYDCSADGPTQDPMLNVGVTCQNKLTKPECEGAAPGYLDNKIPACGQPGNWGKCIWDAAVLACKSQVIDPTLKMGCK